MAIDEALLDIITGPLLRTYRWERPAVSFGYFERWTPIREMYAGRDAVRRWTGGGVVLHGEDLTYSILIPASHPASALGTAESYRVIHGALCAALAGAGIDAIAATSSAAKVSQACFENAVLHDVLANGRKVAGAAQRRTKAGLIHQGSIQFIDLPPDVTGSFAHELAAEVSSASPDVTAQAGEIAAAKYATVAWLEMRI